MIRSSLFALAAILLLASCDKKRVFDEYMTVGPAWSKDSVVSFTFNQKDTKKQYEMFVNVRDNNDYKFSNLFLIVALQQPDGKTTVDTLEYLMANPDGTLMGDGFSDIKENKLFYKKQAFQKAGDYTVRISQAVRQTGKVQGVKELDGITEVGFRIESTE